MRVAPRLPGLANQTPPPWLENLSCRLWKPLGFGGFFHSLFSGSLDVTSHYLGDWICFKMYSVVPLSTRSFVSIMRKHFYLAKYALRNESSILSICVFVLPDPCKDWCAWLWKVSSISRRHARDVHQLSRTCCMLVRMDRIEPQAITACWMYRSRVSSNICIIYEVMLLNIFLFDKWTTVDTLSLPP